MFSYALVSKLASLVMLVLLLAPLHIEYNNTLLLLKAVHCGLLLCPHQCENQTYALGCEVNHKFTLELFGHHCQGW